MSKIDHQESTLEKWLRKLCAPVSSFYSIKIKPEIIRQETMHAGKPLALYETLLFSILFCLFIFLGLLSIVGVKWNAWIGLAGLIVTVSFLVVEVLHLRLWSFSQDVKLARSIILLFLLLIVMYFFQIAVSFLS